MTLPKGGLKSFIAIYYIIMPVAEFDKVRVTGLIYRNENIVAFKITQAYEWQKSFYILMHGMIA